MDIASVLRDMDSIDNGRWVDGGELPKLGDVRIKVRGLSGTAQLEKVAKLQRDGMGEADAFGRVMKDYCFLDIDGLFDGEKKLTAEEVRPLLDDPAWTPVAIWIIDAVNLVDRTTQAKAKALSKN